jgi:ferritin-like protein
MDSQDTKNRREFLKTGVLAAGAATVAGGGLLAGALPALGAQRASGSLSRGDAAIIRFLSAFEQIEADLWQQYTELGGVQDSEMEQIIGHKLAGGNVPYTNALNQLDGDMSQYIHDNTEDEFSHHNWLNDFLQSKGVAKEDLSQFKTLEGSKAEGALQVGRITNLLQLTVDTTWWTRLRARDFNPDLNPNHVFPPAVKGLAMGQHRAIPLDNSDLTPNSRIQSIANTAGFHFAFIEQGGASLYMQLAQRAKSKEVLQILLSIGPTETMHFQTWHDKAGNAITPPLAPLTDPKNPQLVWPNIDVDPGGEDFQANLIMPEPTFFLTNRFHHVSILRPTNTQGAAMAATQSFISDGLFIGQPKAFLELIQDLARDADEARDDIV